MDYLHFVMPLGDGYNIEDIPKDVMEAAKKSEILWEEYLKREKEKEIEELKSKINMLKTQNICSNMSIPNQISQR